MKFTLVFTVFVAVSGCATPSAYKRWDKDLSPAHAEVVSSSAQEIIDSVYPYFDYQLDEFNEWEIPEPNEYGRYQGDCEDYALLVGGRLQQAGIPFRLVRGIRYYERRCCDGPTFGMKGHIMVQLSDGRYIDNNHPEPFSQTRYEIIWRSPEL